MKKETEFNNPCKDCPVKSMCKDGCNAKVMYKSLHPKLVYPLHIWIFIIVVISALAMKLI